MTKKHLMISIDWFGLYTLEEAFEAAQRDYDHALYICTGKQKNERLKSSILGSGKTFPLV